MNAIHPETERQTPESFRAMLRRLDWRLELLGVSVVLAEATLVYLVTGILLAGSLPGSPVLPAWIVVMLLLTAHIVPHLLDEWRIWSPEYELITAVAIILSLAVAIKGGAFPQIGLWERDWIGQTLKALAFLPNDSIRPVWGLVVLAAYAWWRGRSRAEPSVDSAYGMLRVGSIALAVTILLVLVAAGENDQVRERLSIATIGFFVTSLAAIGIARLKLEGFRTSAPLGPRWLATFVAPIVAVVVVAIIGAGIFSRQFLDTVLWMLSPIFWFLELVFEVFVLILAIIALIVLTPIVWLIGDRQPRTLPSTPVAPDDGKRGLLEQVGGRAFEVPDPLRYLIAAIVLFFIFSALTKFVFRRRRKDRGATEEERESVLEWSDMLGALNNRLRSLFQRANGVDDPFADLRGDERWRYTLAIRETYLRLQDYGAGLGRPRRLPETADEYRPGIADRLDVPGAIAIITERYRQARYSGIPATAEEAAEAEHAWRQIEQARHT